MTGWRLGYALAPAPIINAMTKLQSQSTSSTAHMVQMAGLAAVSGPQDCVEKMKKDYILLRDLTLGHLSLIPGVTCEACHGSGARHVAAAQAGKLGNHRLIFNPGNLDATDSINFCGSCHRTALDVLKLGQHGPKTVRFQPYRLVSSRCWDGWDKRISCIACHDPHKALQQNSREYDVKCLSCHASESKPDAQHRAPACTVSKSNCISCHMPKVDLPGGHARFTDHYIRIVRPGGAHPD